MTLGMLFYYVKTMARIKKNSFIVWFPTIFKRIQKGVDNVK